jgi:hypothetical protein
MWLFPCWMACTSATPPPDVAGPTKEAEILPAAAPAAAPAAPPICELGATRPCYPGPEATAGVGACKAGVETCEAAGFGACTGAVVPAADEDCRTPHDEDCDGRSDDCPEVAVAFATAFTSDDALAIDAWGGGLGIVSGERVWVLEPGGRVFDLLERELARWGSSEELEEDQESDAEYSAVGGAWPGALLRTYDTAATRAGYMMAQERWDGSTFMSVENTDDYLQWRYEQVMPWRDGHAIALQTWYESSGSMSLLDFSALEYGAIGAAERRRLQRKVDRLLAKAKPRLVIVEAEEHEPWEASFGLFSVEGEEDEEDEDDAAPPKEDPVAPAAAEPTKPVTETSESEEEEEAAKPSPQLPQPPALPDALHAFTTLSDGTVVILTPQGLRSWKPKQRRWAELEPPRPSFTPTPGAVALNAGRDGELLVLECPRDLPSALWRREGTSWSAVPLPTPACPKSLAVGPDRTRWILVEDQLWQRRAGDAEPWKRVPLPSPWKPRWIAVFDGQVWIAAEDDAERWAVLVDRLVPKTRVLPPPE